MVRFGDLTAEGEADAGAIRLRREEGHEEVAALREAGPVILDPDFHEDRTARPTDADRAVGLAGRVDGVVHQVDEELIQLVTVRSDPGGRPGLNLDRQAGLEIHDACDPLAHVQGDQLRRWEARQPSV